MSERKPGYATWRREIRQVITIVNRMYAEIGDYMNDRSDAWQDSPRADALNADYDCLAEIITLLDDMELK